MADGTRVHVWRLTARCPECGASVRLRNSDAALKLLALAQANGDIHPDTVLQTYQCARKLPDGHLCNALVEIRARHWRQMP